MTSLQAKQLKHITRLYLYWPCENQFYGRFPIFFTKQNMEQQAHMPLSQTSVFDTTVDLKKANKHERRRKLMLTMSLYVGFLSLGLSFSIVGPTLLVLQRNTGTTTKDISLVFMARSLCGVFGAVLSGFIIDRVNAWILLSIVMAISGVCFFLIPYIDILLLLCGIFAITGFAGAFYDAGGNMVLLKVWGKDNGPWMQALHCIFGLGALLGPLLAEPFLDSQSYTYNGQQPEEEIYIPGNTSTTLSNPLEPVSTIATYILNSSVNNLTEVASLVSTQNSGIHFAYIILASTLLLSAACLLCSGICYNNLPFQCLTDRRKSLGSDLDDKDQDPENKKFRLRLIIMVFFFYLGYCIVEINYCNYLSVYAVKDLGWSEKDGAHVTSGYWTTFTLGRAVGIVLVRFLQPSVILIGDLMVTLVSLGILLFFSRHHYMVLWGCSLTLGLGTSTVFATGITWTEQYIEVIGFAGAIFMAAGAGGEMVGPIIIGILMETVGPIAFLYVMFAAAIFILVLFSLMQYCAERHGKRMCSKELDVETISLNDIRLPPPDEDTRTATSVMI